MNLLRASANRLSACGRALRPWLWRTLLPAAVLDPSGQASPAERQPCRTAGARFTALEREPEPIDRVRARLEALLKANAAPRCGARSKRTGKPCQGAAMPNGRCKLHGGKSTGPRTVEGLERSRRANRKHGHFSEVVAHRSKINDSDALNFAKAFHTGFFDGNDGFEPSRAAFKARKAGSFYLRYSPVVISQRQVRSAYRMAT